MRKCLIIILLDRYIPLTELEYRDVCIGLETIKCFKYGIAALQKHTHIK